jgi:hypothetical protein
MPHLVDAGCAERGPRHARRPPSGRPRRVARSGDRQDRAGGGDAHPTGCAARCRRAARPLHRTSDVSRGSLLSLVTMMWSDQDDARLRHGRPRPPQTRPGRLAEGLSPGTLSTASRSGLSPPAAARQTGSARQGEASGLPDGQAGRDDAAVQGRPRGAPSVDRLDGPSMARMTRPRGSRRRRRGSVIAVSSPTPRADCGFWPITRRSSRITFAVNLGAGDVLRAELRQRRGQEERDQLIAVDRQLLLVGERGDALARNEDGRRRAGSVPGRPGRNTRRRRPRLGDGGRPSHWREPTGPLRPDADEGMPRGDRIAELPPCFRFAWRASACARVRDTVVTDEQETSDQGAGLRPLSSVVAVVGACADGAPPVRPERARPVRRCRRPLVRAMRESGADQDASGCRVLIDAVIERGLA